MKPRLHRIWSVVALLLGLLFMLPTEARADAIDLPFVFVAGSIILIPLMAFEVLVESGFLSIGLRVAYRRLLKVVLLANIASLAAGVPVKMLNAWMHASILPRDLASYFRSYPYAVVMGTFIYFVVTLVAEYLIIRAWCRKEASAVATGRIALFVFVANLATYAVLAPVHYFAARPTHDIREFTDTTEWASRPLTTIYYVDGPSGHLCSVASNGQDKREILADEVKDYQFMPDSGTVLYRNASNTLYLSKADSPARIECWKADRQVRMEQVAVSPDGQYVGYLKRIGELKPYRLVLYDTTSGRTADTDITTHEDEYNPEIAWSASPSVVFLKHKRRLEAIRIGPDLSVSVIEDDPIDNTLAVVYGRFGPLGHDEADSTEVRALRGLDSHIQVTMNGDSFYLADNPGLLKISRRHFNDVCILANGRELVFSDHYGLYLMDMDKRVVGKIADGEKFLVLSDRYRRKI